MKNKFILVLMVLIPSFIYAHSLLLNVFDNQDNTITVEGVFNTGELASGAQIRLESLISDKILYKKRLPDEGELIIQIPKEPYNIVMNGGAGHQIVKKGIAPIEGFKKELNNKIKTQVSKPNKQKDSSSKIILIAVVTAILLLFITIFISIRNTNKLMRELKIIRR